MDSNGTLHFTATAKQTAQRKVQLRGLGVEFGDLHKGINGTVGLLIEQEIQAFEVRVGQIATLV